MFRAGSTWALALAMTLVVGCPDDEESHQDAGVTTSDAGSDASSDASSDTSSDTGSVDTSGGDTTTLDTGVDLVDMRRQTCTDITCGANQHCEEQGLGPICLCDDNYSLVGEVCEPDAVSEAFYNLPSEVSGPLGSARRFRPELLGLDFGAEVSVEVVSDDCDFDVEVGADNWLRWDCPEAAVECSVDLEASEVGGNLSASATLDVVCEDRPRGRLAVDLVQAPNDPQGVNDELVVGDTIYFRNDEGTFALTADNIEVVSGYDLRPVTALGDFVVFEYGWPFTYWLWDGADWAPLPIPDGLTDIRDVQLLDVWEGELYYVVEWFDSVELRTLVASDGSPGGTSEIADWTAFHSRNVWTMPSPEALIVLNNNSTSSQLELWATDGTVEGSLRLVEPGDLCGSRLAVWDGVVHFLGLDEMGCNLSSTDGTLDGTVRYSAVEGISNGDVKLMVAGDSGLYILTDDGSSDIWFTNGTELGTEMIRDLGPDTYLPFAATLTVIGDVLYYISSTGLENARVWRYDVDGDTLEQVSGDGYGSVSGVLALAGKVYYTQYLPMDQDVVPQFHDSLWVTTGLAADAEFIMDTTEDPRFLTTDSEYFFVNEAHIWELDVTDDTVAVGPLTELGGVRNFGQFSRGDALHFWSIERDVVRSQVHTTDGSGASQASWLPEDTLTLSGWRGEALSTRAVVFGDIDLNDSGSYSDIVFRIDGTSEGTQHLESQDSTLDDPLVEHGWGTDSDQFIRFGDVAYFGGADGNVWQTDGTNAGTHHVATVDIPFGDLRWLTGEAQSGQLFALVQIDEEGSARYSALYGIDLSSGDVTRIDHDDDRLPRASADLTNYLQVIGERLVYIDYGNGVWSFTVEGGEVQLADMTVGATCFGPDAAYFIQTPDHETYTLRRTDGTVEGTVDLNFDRDVVWCKASDEALWLVSNGEGDGFDVTHYDLATNTTTLVASEVAVLMPEFVPPELHLYGDSLALIVDDVRGPALWLSDGTVNGSGVVQWDADGPDRVTTMYSTPNRLYVLGWSALGDELWVVE